MRFKKTTSALLLLTVYTGLKTVMRIHHYIAVFVLVSATTACQTAQPVAKPTTIDNSSFMTLWGTYRHCERGTDPELMRTEAQQLHAVATASRPTVEGDFPLPTVITRWMSEPANRLAVDPKAMAAACGVHTGETALAAGRHDIAGEMFSLVVKYPETTYSYYVNQARGGLARIELDANADGAEAGSTRLVSLPSQSASAR